MELPLRWFASDLHTSLNYSRNGKSRNIPATGDSTRGNIGDPYFFHMV